jgi:hypothetical protein
MLMYKVIVHFINSGTVNALKISIAFTNQHVTVTGQALVDSGATENFINYQMAV